MLKGKGIFDPKTIRIIRIVLNVINNQTDKHDGRQFTIRIERKGIKNVDDDDHHHL